MRSKLTRVNTDTIADYFVMSGLTHTELHTHGKMPRLDIISAVKLVHDMYRYKMWHIYVGDRNVIYRERVTYIRKPRVTVSIMYETALCVLVKLAEHVATQIDALIIASGDWTL
eukprot:9401937-Karenia_brevis.AAC.1